MDTWAISLQYILYRKPVGLGILSPYTSHTNSSKLFPLNSSHNGQQLPSCERVEMCLPLFWKIFSAFAFSLPANALTVSQPISVYKHSLRWFAAVDIFVDVDFILAERYPPSLHHTWTINYNNQKYQRHVDGIIKDTSDGSFGCSA